MSGRLRIMLKVLLALLLIYLLVCAVAYFAQDKMLFPAPPDRGQLPPGAERLALPSADGVELAGLAMAAAARDPHAPLILAFGGNGWSADAAAATLRDVYPGAVIVAFHYRGYPPSGGRPSTRAIMADSLAVYDEAARRFPGRRIVAVGFSIGTGFAAHLAAHRPLAGLILVTPFDSLTEVAVAQLPFLPVRALFRNPMDAAAELRGARLPVAILAAGEDRLVRRERTDGLRRAVPNLVYDRTIARVGHNDIYWAPAFAPAMQEAMARVLAR